MKFTCGYCGKKFEAVQFWARYCSDSCRVKAYQKREKAKQDKQDKQDKKRAGSKTPAGEEAKP